MKNTDAIKANYLNILLYLVAAILIGMLRGLEVLIILALFILLFGLILSTLLSGYYAFKGIKDKKLLLTGIGALVASCIIFLAFGKQVFLNTALYSFVLATIVTLVIIYFSSRK